MALRVVAHRSNAPNESIKRGAKRGSKHRLDRPMESTYGFGLFTMRYYPYELRTRGSKVIRCLYNNIDS